ncbi:uncharacterized protein LOC124265046 [Haliotis rubra]|uniref:uncharacterized protein LOC124265046 n=1 Tax=Haliotis rubra TaxID=36100 RepID=UPI001EE5F669|nr:uncharacterized protein LOC124265046 [Haliotis rubra]
MELQVFRKFWSRSLYTCASECLMSSACLSFGFDKKARTCLLNSNSSDTANVVDRTGFLFSDIQHWPKSLSGGCTQRTCQENRRCEVTRLGRARCVPEFQGCGEPPEVRDANITYDGHYQGAVATFSCGTDFRTCYNNVTSTCQSSGAWESLRGLCGQYRWHNPIEEQFSFPCDPPSTFRLMIRGTPTQETRWRIEIKREADNLFYSDFRFYYHPHRMVIVVNTKFDGTWGEEIYTHLSMTVGQESEVDITLQNGLYMLVIDGASVSNMTERVSGAKPNHIKILGDVSVGMVEFIS